MAEFRWETNFSRNLALVELLRGIAERHNRSVGEVAIAWTLRHPAVTGAIVGVRNARQAEGVMRAGDLRLTDEEVNEIETFFGANSALPMPPTQRFGCDKSWSPC